MHVNPENHTRVANKRSKDKDTQRPDNSPQRPTNKNKNNFNSRWQYIVKFGAQSQKKCRKTSGPIKAGLESKMLLHFRPRSVKLAKHEPGTIQIINRPNSKAIPYLQHSANRPTLEFGKAMEIKRRPGKLLDVFFFMYPLSSWTSFISGKNDKWREWLSATVPETDLATIRFEFRIMTARTTTVTSIGIK